MPHLRPRVRAVLLSALAAVIGLIFAGCGFRPMYSERALETSPVSTDLAAIDVALIPDRSGQLLRNRLERLLDPATAQNIEHQYTLSVQLREKIETFAVERSGFATRATVEMSATYVLQEEAAGTQVLAGNARSISSYNLLDNDFSTVVGADDARNRALDQLAYEIRNRLAAHFASRAQVASVPATAEGSESADPAPMGSPAPGDRDAAATRGPLVQ